MRPPYLHERVMDFLVERLPRYRQAMFERQRQAETFAVWVVGLSSGAIALILSGSKIFTLVLPLAVKTAVACSAATILAAVVFRAAFYLLEQVASDLVDHFEGFCFGYRSRYYGPMEITERHTIEQIARSLKEDMGVDYDSWLDKDYLTRDFWVDHYNRWADFWQAQEIEGLRTLAKAIAPLAGIDPEEAEAYFLGERKDRDLSRRGILLRKVGTCSFVLMLAFFVASVTALAAGFLAH